MKTLRMRRLFRGGRAIFAAMDHGVTLGPIPGLVSIRDTVDLLVTTGAVNALILHKGALHRCTDLFVASCDTAAIMHLNGAEAFGPFSTNKELLSTVEDALRLGADAVSFHINLGNEHTPALLRDLGRVSSDCLRWGMPLLVMVVVQGPGVDSNSIAHQCTAARIAMEVGADVVKIQHPGSAAALREIIAGVDIPVLVAGGGFQSNTRSVLHAMHQAVVAGAQGFAIGRNLFGHTDPQAMGAALGMLLHEQATADQAWLRSRGETE